MRLNFLETLSLYNDYIKHLENIAQAINLIKTVQGTENYKSDNALDRLHDVFTDFAIQLRNELEKQFLACKDISLDEAAYYGLEDFHHYSAAELEA